MEVQKIDNKIIVVGLVCLIVGGLIGWSMGARSVGQGPLADLQSKSSSAHNYPRNMTCDQLWDGAQYEQSQGHYLDANWLFLRFHKAGCVTTNLQNQTID